MTGGEDTAAENRAPAAREPREGRGERGEGRRGRGERGEGRNGRGPRADGEARGNGEGRQSPSGFADTEPTSAVAGETSEGSAAPVDNGDATAQAASRAENGEPREKRQRDRYGRDRGPRGERSERAERNEAQAELATAAEPAVATEAPVAPATAMPVARAAAVASATPAAAAPGMPKVTPYALPTEALLDVAQQSGLQWVNSDAAKVQAVQAAIAAEPKPIHVPRERPAPVVLDEGPLVLVETKRDLRDMTLPFEQSSAAQ